MRHYFIGMAFGMIFFAIIGLVVWLFPWGLVFLLAMFAFGDWSGQGDGRQGHYYQD